MLDRAHSENNTNNQRRKKRESSFLHDATAFNDPKIIRLRQKYSFEGYGVFWAFVEKLRLCQGYQFKYEDLDALSFELHIEFERLREIIDFCIEVGLFVHHEGMIYSRSLDERMEEYNGASRVNSENGKKGGLASAAKRKEKEESAALAVSSEGQAPLEPPPSAYNTIQYNLIESNSKESKKGECRGGISPPKDLKPPENIKDPPFLSDALSFLVPEDDPILNTNGINSVTGRRPMRNFPQIWITPVELADAIEICIASKVPEDKISYVFKFVQSKIKTAVAKGDKAEKICAYSWLTGFGLEQTLKVLKSGKDLERTEQYLDKARA